MDDSAQFIIVGAGLAGLAVAEQLLRFGAAPGSVRVADARDPKRGSDNPGATLHPFPGGSVSPDPEKLSAARAASETVEHWRSRWAEAPIRTFPMVRPLGERERSRRLRDSWLEPAEYPDWLEIRRLSASQLGDVGLDPSDWTGAIAYRPAYCIDLGELRALLVEFLRSEGVEIRTDVRVRTLRREGDQWVADLSVDQMSADRVVLAVGRSMADWFPELAMECRGGELLRTEPQPDRDLDCAVHADGDVAPAPGGGLVAGATWWEPSRWDERTDAGARRAIARQCREIVPDLAERTGRIWRGVRSGFGDYQPLVGPVPSLEGLHAMGGFGGTGLLSVPRHARGLARHLLDEPCALRELARPDRMGADKWRPAPEQFGRVEPSGQSVRHDERNLK